MILKLAYRENDPANNPYWENMRNHDYSKSFPAVKDFIRQNAPNKRRPRKRRSRITWALVALLPLAVFFSCQRKTYIEPQGATLTFTLQDSLSPTIELAVRQYAVKEWMAVFRPHAGKIRGTIYSPVEQYEKLKAFAETLKAMPGVSELYLSTMKTSIKESPLSRLSYRVFNLHIDAIDATDEQLRSEIAAKLKETGQENLQLELVKENGKKQLWLVPTDKTRDFSIDFTLRDGTTVTAIAEKW